MATRFVPLILGVVIGGLFLAIPSAHAADTTPPWAGGWGPTGSGVPVDTGFLVAWSEGMDWTSVQVSFSYKDNATTYTQGTWTHDALRNTSSFVPALGLRPATRYTVRFDTNARDAAGNRLDQNRNGVGGDLCDIGPPSFWDCLVWSFETAPLAPDTTPPTVLSTSPTSGGTAATSAVIQIVFSESMDTSSVGSSFGYSDGYALYGIGDGAASWTATQTSDDTFSFRPNLEFASGGRITVYLFEGAARDFAGNALDGDGDGSPGGTFDWTFFVEADSRPPTVITTSPPPGAVNVSVSSPTRIQFSKAMSATPRLTLSTPAGPNLTVADGAVEWSGTRFPSDTLVFDPYPNLRTQATYTLTIAAESATDREGLLLDGNGNGTAEGSPGDDYGIAFRTEAEDRTAPTVVRRHPEDGAGSVYPGTSIDTDFSEAVNRTSVESSFSFTDGAGTFHAGDGTFLWYRANSSFSFRPTSSLPYGVEITVSLDGSVARDETGNSLNGRENETWRFTTVSQPDTTAPYIVSTSPFDGQENVSRNARVTIVFSEAMDHPSVEEAVGITGGASLRDFRWPNDATLELGTAAPLAYRSPYAVLVFTGAKDLAGNPIAQSAVISFTTQSWRGRVSGRTADVGGVGVPGVLVRLNGFSFLTDDLGAFSFEVEQGTYTLTASKAGYETVTIPVTILPGGSGLGTITLKQLSASAADAALWAGVGTALLLVLLAAIWVRRRRTRVVEHYETWKPAKVVVLEPGRPPPKVR